MPDTASITVTETARTWIAVVTGSPAATALHIGVRSAEPDDITLTMPFADDATTTPGVLHGGVVATLIDTAGAAASASAIADDATGGATTHLAVTYLAPARGDLLARARVAHRTRSTTTTEVTVRGADGALVALGAVSSRTFY